MRKREPRGRLTSGSFSQQAGLGGNSFNDLALEGVRKAAEDFGITYDQVEPKSVADEEIIQDEMASSEEYDLIICVGDEQVDALENVASVYTDQKFALLDATSDLPNVASYSCKAQEGSFMVGALAVLAKQEQIDGKLSDGDTIGFIGGVDYTVEGSNIKVPDNIISRLDEIREEIISGEIEVPNELD